jgi:hypothetical protein
VAKPDYVRITFREVVGTRTVRRTWWAAKLGATRYKKVDVEGQWGNDSKLHLFVGTPDRETPAVMDLFYSHLTTGVPKTHASGCTSDRPSPTAN